MYKHLKTQSYYEGVDFHELYRGTSTWRLWWLQMAKYESAACFKQNEVKTTYNELEKLNFLNLRPF
jgi:hypothetical protein